MVGNKPKVDIGKFVNSHTFQPSFETGHIELKYLFYVFTPMP